MKENNVKNAFEYLDDAEYIIKTASFNLMGKSLVDHKKLSECIVNAREATEKLREKSLKIEMREQRIYEEAEKKCDLMIQETQEQIGNMNTVKEAEAYAFKLVEQAQENAEQIKMEALEIRNNTITHGEKVKNELINQGYQYVESAIEQLIKLVNENTGNISKMFEENQASLSEGIQMQLEKLNTDYEEIKQMVNKGDSEIAS